MKIKPEELVMLIKELNENEELKQKIYELERTIGGLNTVVITLKDFRDKALKEGYEPKKES